MKGDIPDSVKERFKRWQKSPLEFAEAMWGLTPQPLYEEYFDKAQDAINRGAWGEFKAEWFMPFESRNAFLHDKHLTWQQWLIFLSVERALIGEGPRRISVASGHGTGKDAALAMLILWFLYCYKNAQVPCTAPSSDQMYDVLWKEIAIWMRKMPPGDQERYVWATSYVRMTESPMTWFARAKTARKESPEALAGVHGDHVFMAVDEASGVFEEIFNTAEGALTNDNILVLLISNPTRLIGYFYESQHLKCMLCDAHFRTSFGVQMWKGGDPVCEHMVLPALDWQRLQFNSEESPIVDPQFVARMAAKHGRDSDEYKIRVLGRFADDDAVDDEGYVPLLSIDDIKEVPDTGGFRKGWARLGVDPAGEGKNETVFVVRDRFRAKIVAVEKISSGESIAKKTLSIMELYQIPDWQVTVDAFGEGIDAVQELALSGARVYAVNTGDGCLDKADNELFVNIRAMISWRTRQWLKKSGELLRNKRWRQCTVIRYRRQLSGKLKVMDKLEMRKRGIPSPDAWDALTLTFARPDDFEVKERHMGSDEDASNATSVYDH